MLKLTIKDWTGLEISSTEMTERELGFDGDTERLKQMAQNVANEQTGSVTIEQNGSTIVRASFLNEL